MANPHRKILQLISTVNESRAKTFLGESPYYPFFWDTNGTAKPIEEVLKTDYPREETAKELPNSLSGQYGAWIPPNIALSCLLAFERDSRAMTKTRREIYGRASVARGKQKTLLDNFMKSIDKLEGRAA